MEEIFFNTKEVAEYLGIHEKHVYALIKAGRIPCTRVTGKWIFPKNFIDEWIKEDALTSISKKNIHSKNYLLAAGSNDPVLDILLNTIRKNKSLATLYISSTGSTDGLERLKNGETDIAFCHLLDHDSGKFNIPFVENLLKGKKFAIVHLFYRQQGFLSLKNSKYNIISFSEIKKNNLKIINRQPGSGTRLLIDYYMEKEKISPEEISGYKNEVCTHVAVALKILNGDADIGVGTIAMASLFNLEFNPLIKESFDMVMLQETFFSETVQNLINNLTSKNFKKDVKPMGDYNFNKSGTIIYSGKE